MEAQCCDVVRRCGFRQKLDNTMDIISVCVEFHCGSLMAKTFQNSKVSTVDRLPSKDLGQTSPFPVIRSQF